MGPTMPVMAQAPAETPGKPKRKRSPRSRRAPAPRNPRLASTGPGDFRDRLRRDRFLFGTSLAFLAFTTGALAVTWRLVGDPVLLTLTIVSVLPAFYLFYLRDGSSA